MIQEKGDAAELVLDGHLIGEQTMEVNLAELLDIARKEFENGSHAVTVDAKALEKEWPPLRSELSSAVHAWRLKGLELIGVPVGQVHTRGEETENPATHQPLNQVPSRFQIPLSPTSSIEHAVPKIQSPASLDIEGESITLFAELPLFEHAQ